MDLAHVNASDIAYAYSTPAASFVWLRICVQGDLQLRRSVADGSLLYVKFSVDPGNQSATTNTLDPARLKALNEDVQLLLASDSLHLLRLELIIEVYLVDSHAQHKQECVGCNRVGLQERLSDSQAPKDITLFGKRGRGRAGSVQIVLSIERYDNSAMSTQPLVPKLIPACGILRVAVLCCEGLDDSVEAVARVKLVQEESKRYTSDVAVCQSANNVRFVWNQVYEFAQERGDVALEMNIQILNDAVAPSEVVGEITVDISQLESEMVIGRKTYVWLPLQTINSVNTSVQLCIALWNSKVTRSDVDTSLSDDQSNSINNFSDRVQATASTGQAIPLGSTLAIQIDSLCQVNEFVHGQIRSLSSSNKQPDQAFSICAQVVPCGAVSRVQVPSNCIVIDGDHCKYQAPGACIRGISAPLQVELTPEIVQASQLLNGNLMLQLEIRPSRSRSWSLSACFSLTSFYQDHNTETGFCSITAPCLDQDDNTSGFVRLILSRGPNGCEHNLMGSVINTTKRLLPNSSVSLAVQEIHLPASIVSDAPADGDKQFYTEIWSNRLSRKRAQQSTSFAQSTGSLLKVKATKDAGFQVADLYSEVFFLEVRVSRQHERNQLIGWCFFTIPVDDFNNNRPGEDKSDSSKCLTMRLHQLPKRILSRPQSNESGLIECGHVVLNVRVETSQPDQTEPLSMASSLLSGVVYDLLPTTDCRGKFEIQLVDAQNCDSLAAGNMVQVGFRIASAKWKARSRAGLVKQVEERPKQIVWDESFETIMSWSSRDRAAPTLELTLLQIQQPAKSVQLAKIIQKKSREDVFSAIIGNYDLDLCALLTHSQSWVQVNIPVLLAKELDPNQSPRTPSIVSVGVNLRWSPINKTSDGRSQILGSEIPPPQSRRDGDISVLILNCSGSFLRREDSLSTYYVTLSCAAQSVQTRTTASDNDRASWNEQLSLELNSSASPIICVQLYRRKSKALGLTGSEEESSSDELVGFLSIPIFPFIVESQHLMSLSLPVVSRSEERTHSVFRKCGVLALEIQYFARIQSNDNSMFSQDLELVLHQVRQMRGSNGVMSDRCKHIRFQVLLACSSSSEPEIIVCETNLQCIPTSGSSTINEVVLLNHSVLNRINNSDKDLWVIALYLCDVNAKRIGQIHIPLRRDWEQQMERKTSAWYPIYTEHASDIVPRPSESMIELSFQKATPINRPAANKSLLGRIFFACKQVIVHFRGDSSPLNSETKAWIEIGLKRFTSRKAFKSTIKQLGSGGHWSWESESIAVDNVRDCDDQETILVQFVYQQLSISLECQLMLSMCLGDGNFVPVDRWLVLNPAVSSQIIDIDSPIKAHLEVQMMYVPDQSGEFSVQLNELRPLPASSICSLLFIERALIKCVLQGKIYATPVRELGSSLSESTEWELQELLVMPFSSLSDCDTRRFQLSLEWIGISRTGDELHLGELSIDLLPFLAKSNSSVRWCTFHDKRNDSKPTAAISVSIDFRPRKELSPSAPRYDPRFTRPMLRSERQILLSQVMTVWKKLFYSLDTNQNGRIDLEEFKLLFLHHLKDLALTTDGKQLLTILFDKDESLDLMILSLEMPTDRELELLFAEMDTNEDHEIEWDEFLQFLRHRIEYRHPIIEQEQSELVIEKRIVSPVPASQHREVRRKKREDTNVASVRDLLDTRSSGALLVPPSSTDKLRPPATLATTKSSCLPSPAAAAIKGGSSELQTQVKSLQTLLGLEKKKYDQLHQNWMELQRKHRQLELQQQKRSIQDQTREQWVKQTTEHQEKVLKERELARQKCHVASIVLQSNLRSRLEQKRFQALKLNRANAAITIQCFTRVHFARKELITLQIAHEQQKRLIGATLRVQRFFRFFFRRREREMMTRARELSAQIIQKHGRRIVATKRWSLKRSAILTLQCWIRQRLARRRRNDLGLAITRINRAVLGWIHQWRWNRIKKSAIRLKRWWKRVRELWRDHIELLDASVCIQATWRGRKQRLYYELLRATILLERETALKRGLMARFIQARWRYLQQYRVRIQCKAVEMENASSYYLNGIGVGDETGAANSDLSAFKASAEDTSTESGVKLHSSPGLAMKNETVEDSIVNGDVAMVLIEMVRVIESAAPAQVSAPDILKPPDIKPVEDFTTIDTTDDILQQAHDSEHDNDLESESEGEESGDDKEDEASGGDESGTDHESKVARCEMNKSAQLTISPDSAPNPVLTATASDKLMENPDPEHGKMDANGSADASPSTQSSLTSNTAEDSSARAIAADDAVVQTAAVLEHMIITLGSELITIPDTVGAQQQPEADGTESEHPCDNHTAVSTDRMEDQSATAEMRSPEESMSAPAFEKLEQSHAILDLSPLIRVAEESNDSNSDVNTTTRDISFDSGTSNEESQGDECTPPDHELGQVELTSGINCERVNEDEELVASLLEELLDTLRKEGNEVENYADESSMNHHHAQGDRSHNDLLQAAGSNSSGGISSADASEGDDRSESDGTGSSQDACESEHSSHSAEFPSETDEERSDQSGDLETTDASDSVRGQHEPESKAEPNGHETVLTNERTGREISRSGSDEESSDEEDVLSADSDDLMLEATALTSLELLDAPTTTGSPSDRRRILHERRQSHQMRHLDSHKILSDLHQIHSEQEPTAPRAQIDAVQEEEESEHATTSSIH